MLMAKNKLNSTLAMLILWCLTLVPGGLAHGAQAALRILGNERLPPFTWTQDEESVGLAVDLTRAAAEKAGLTLQIEGRHWPTAQQEVLAGKADALLHINPNPEREKVFDFSDPLIASHFTIFRLTARPEIHGEQALHGKTVGVEEDGFVMHYLQKYDRIKLVMLPNWKAGFTSLAEGKIDAIVVDRSVGEWALRSYNIAGVTVDAPALLTTSSRIAVKKGNTALLARLNQGLAMIAQDGTRQRILDRWSDKEVVYVARRTVSRLIYAGAGVGGIVMLLSLAYAWKTRKTNLQLRQHDARLKDEIHERQLAQSALQRSLNTLEQRVAERTAALAASEEHFRLLVEQSPDGIFVADSSGHYIDVNSTGAAMLGYTREEILARSMADILVAEDIPRIAVEVGRFAGGGVVTSEWTFRRKDGSTFFGELVGQQLPDGRLQGILRNIADRRAAERALRESEEKYRNLFTNMAEEVHLWQLVRDENGQIKTWRLVDVNPPALKAWGRQSLDELRGKTTDEIFGLGATAHYLPVVQKIMTEGQPHSFEDYFPHLDKYFRFTSVPQGEYFITTGADITAIKKAEALLQEERDRLAALISNIRDEIWFANVHGQFTLVNPAGRNEFNLGQGETVTDVRQLAESLEVFCADGTPRPVADAPALRALRGEFLMNEEEVIRTPSSGELRHRQVSAAPVRNNAGEIIGSVSVVRDITEQKREAQRLIQALEAADRANNAKSRFLAAASHDLRQPLAAISIYTNMLQKTQRPSDQLVVANMQKCISSLSALLNDLLDLSKLDAGVVTPSVSSFSVAELFDGLVSDYQPKASAKGIRLRCVPTQLTGRTDVVLLRRMLGNLLDNALRYTERGGVLFGVRHRLGKTWVEVWDSGIGIPADKTAEIFEEFRQLGDQARNHGSGLGLAIVARTAALLGLGISVRSRLGHGSVFAVELPLGEAQSVLPACAPPLAGSRCLRIAFVEDNPMFRAAMVTGLQALGHQVVATASQAALLAELEQFTPDIVVSDYRLPHGETGIEVISAVRAHVGTELPAILVTGDTDPELLRSMNDRGIVVMHKPIDLATLQTHFEDLTARRGLGLDGAKRLPVNAAGLSELYLT